VNFKELFKRTVQTARNLTCLGNISHRIDQIAAFLSFARCA
jgi:hypothetical protein